MAEIHCSFSNASYVSAQKGLALLFCSREVLFEPDEWVLFIQIHGHLTANLKWLKDSRAFDRYISFQRPPDSVLDHVLSLPESPTVREKSGSDYRHYCIFTTAKIPVSPVSLYEKGLLVEFDLPAHMLPSYRGRCAHISYYLTVTMQHSTIGSTKKLHFPLQVNSSGCPQDDIYFVKSGGLLAFSPDTISPETFYDTSTLHIISTEHDHSLESQSSHSATSPPVSSITAATFKVRDEGLICTVSVPSLRFVIGRSTSIAMDFTDQEQVCHAIKASILQTEIQSIAKGQGTSHTSQEKVVWSNYHLSDFAEFIQISVNVPEGISSSFSSAALRLEYKLQLEFFLSDQDTDEPLSFAINIEMLSIRSSLEDSFLKMSAAIVENANKGSPETADQRTEYLAMLHRCLDSNSTRVPFVEVDVA